MISEGKTGLVRKHGLSSTEFDEIINLMNRCNQHDGILLKINEDMLMRRPLHEMNDLLYYENNQLIGFLGMYDFNSLEIEISGMIDPAHRRKDLPMSSKILNVLIMWQKEIMR